MVDIVFPSPSLFRRGRVQSAKCKVQSALVRSDCSRIARQRAEERQSAEHVMCYVLCALRKVKFGEAPSTKTRTGIIKNSNRHLIGLKLCSRSTSE